MFLPFLTYLIDTTSLKPVEFVSLGSAPSSENSRLEPEVWARGGDGTAILVSVDSKAHRGLDGLRRSGKKIAGHPSALIAPCL